MSTYLYLQCMAHDPPLLAEAESGQHTYNIEQIQEDVANRGALIAAANLDVITDDYFRRNTVTFLMGHPHCPLELWDEYGIQHPLTEMEGKS